MKILVFSTFTFSFHFWQYSPKMFNPLNGSEIEIVNEFNYLGILLNRTGHFNNVTTKQAEKAKQAMYEVLKRGRTHNLSV
jgi:hypothetical protein